MFQAHKRKQTTPNDRKKMSVPAGKVTDSGMFKHYESAYLAWLKKQLQGRPLSYN